MHIGSLLQGTPVERYPKLKARMMASPGMSIFGAINDRRRKPPYWKNGEWCIKLPILKLKGYCQNSLCLHAALMRNGNIPPVSQVDLKTQEPMIGAVWEEASVCGLSVDSM